MTLNDNFQSNRNDNSDFQEYTREVTLRFLLNRSNKYIFCLSFRVRWEFCFCFMKSEIRNQTNNMLDYGMSQVSHLFAVRSNHLPCWPVSFTVRSIKWRCDCIINHLLQQMHINLLNKYTHRMRTAAASFTQIHTPITWHYYYNLQFGVKSERSNLLPLLCIWYIAHSIPSIRNTQKQSQNITHV